MMMLEPTKPGFTGTVWESRPPEQLARNLTTGVGGAPAAEAGLAWARLGASLGAVAAEYERIVSSIDNAWQSKASLGVVERIRTLRDWLADTAVSAAANGTQAESHAAAYEIARLAMPDTGEVEAIQALQKVLGHVGASLGAPILAKAAQLDGDADVAKAVAARVMRIYEAATESLAIPWEQQRPPTIAANTALETESARATESPEQMRLSVPSMPVGLGGLSPGFGPTPLAPVSSVARDTVRATTTVSETAAVEPVPVQQGSQVPLGPAATGQGGVASEEEHSVRAGLASESVGGTADVGIDTGFRAAPAVLGGAEQVAPRIPVEQNRPTQQVVLEGAPR
ncbi:PPE domain-containing protein [Nocardia sp. CA-107356]|uniref:PPE domain-containing protein n=1 Tax=Nocardia sp. CA-107356 TaxID=3239972 RepID=UPI003D8BF8FF